MPDTRIFGPGPHEPEHYRYTLELCRQNWAWECLRRCEHYQAAFDARDTRRTGLREIAPNTYFRKMRSPEKEAEAFGLCSFRRAGNPRAPGADLLAH